MRIIHVLGFIILLSVSFFPGVDQLHPGAIELLHTVSVDNAQALPDFIQEARARGYQFADLEELRKQSVNTPFPFQ